MNRQAFGIVTFIMLVVSQYSYASFYGSDQVPQITKISDFLDKTDIMTRKSCNVLLTSTPESAKTLITQTHALFEKKDARTQLKDIGIMAGLVVQIQKGQVDVAILPKGSTIETILYKIHAFVKLAVKSAEIVDSDYLVEDQLFTLATRQTLADVSISSPRMAVPAAESFMDLSESLENALRRWHSTLKLRVMTAEMSAIAPDFANKFGQISGQLVTPVDEDDFDLLQLLVLVKAARAHFQTLVFSDHLGNVALFTGFSDALMDLPEKLRAPYSNLYLTSYLSYWASYMAIEKVGKKPLRKFPQEIQDNILGWKKFSTDLLTQWFKMGYVVDESTRRTSLTIVEKFRNDPNVLKDDAAKIAFETLYLLLSAPLGKN